MDPATSTLCSTATRHGARRRARLPPSKETTRGTRSITHIRDYDGTTLTTVYRQYDGYPSGHGADIYRILGSRQVVNGYTDPLRQVNGPGCAAALLVREIKERTAGGVYIVKPDTRGMEEEFVYTIGFDNPDLGETGQIHLRVETENGAALFDGPLDLFDADQCQRIAFDMDEEDD